MTQRVYSTGGYQQAETAAVPTNRIIQISSPWRPKEFETYTAHIMTTQSTKRDIGTGGLYC